MKKMVKFAIVFSILACTFPFNFVHAQEVMKEETDSELKDRLLSYGLYVVVDNDIYLSDDISELPYEDLKEAIREDIIDKMTSYNNGTIIWDPKFVLELAPQEFPDLYPSLYNALLEQGYEPNDNVVAAIEPTLEDERSEIAPYASSYTSTKYYSYVASGHGTVLSVKNTLNWTYSSGTYSITSMAGARTAGWNLTNKLLSKQYNNTANAYGFYSYYALKDAYSYSAYLQIQMVPKSNGTATQVILSQGVNSIGIG